MSISQQDHWINTPHGRLFARSWQPERDSAAPLVLLHDSLGCVALWRDFPELLAQASGRRVIAYDRLGFGRSDPHPGRLAPSFVEDEAQGGFQALRQQLELERFVLLGHSVGGGMAVGCAAAYPQACLGLVSESAQAFVGTETLAGIRAAERQFAAPGQLERLARYHGDKAQWVLRAWLETWQSEAFAAWSLAPLLPRVRCPLLCLHGEQDEYGSPAHPRRIAEGMSGPARLLLVPDCGHVPHREQPQQVLKAVNDFLARLA